MTTHKELFAVVWYVLLPRPYLKGNLFTSEIDLEALKWVITMSDASWKQARWCLLLSVTELDIAYRAIIEHQAAGLLPRLTTVGSDKSKLKHDIPGLSINAKTFRSAECVEIEQQEEKARDYSTPQRDVFPLLPVVYALAN